MKDYLKLTLIAGLLALTTACSDDDDNDTAVVEPPEAPITTVVDVAAASEDFETLTAALQATGLDATLSDTDSQFTVFAPTDDAFALLGQETIDALLEDPDTLSAILTYHVLDSRVSSSAAIDAAGSTIATVNGAALGLSLSGDELLVNTATVTTTDISANNGVIHVIDAVLTPPQSQPQQPTMNIIETAVASDDFTTLAAALEATNLVATLSDESQEFTVFAPTDAAFAALGQATIDTLLANPEVLKEILLQHVVSGSVDSITAFSLNGQQAQTVSGNQIDITIDGENDTLKFGDATVTMTDIQTTNGIIHVLDTVVVGEVQVPAPAQSVVDVAVGNGNFSTLVAALQTTGLDTTLADLEREFTVFAPTDAAFEQLDQATVDALFADAEALSDLLLYHVLPDATVQSDAAIAVANSEQPMITMANGDTATLSLQNDMLYIDNAQVTTANVAADNGVIHVIDSVLMPPSEQSIVDVAVADGNFTTLVSALQEAGLEQTLADLEREFTVFAPTDAAFDKLDQATLDALLADPEALTNVLLYHVVADATVSSDAAIDIANSDNPMVTMANGDMSTLSLQDGALYIDESVVSSADVASDNGVIHVIDTVLMPMQ
ncbi:fasciclin domain-containing protein [Pseudoalteromonas ruthenica]|uniref:fasciclin domain-containing protein n=1 Tax=Pseudoalteromonas ruthenica TaxID=151081 RepID=UPI0005F9DD08|nr:fasciclin domain-containing protein [Pseudoalteromonas ruthenica]TMO98526.1 adhesion lipoprotein [Pseudoalteromonas ruthenica]TMP07487.1 adhesion lipoprotein [Pseudoalteromonas ruthenica]TMP10111.1 adhesion lipoprotein [Pseudoalteromonas ruthenica]TMP22939.1 adhesion lipoprotein [Pseudoalteromonas ruthenica]